EAEVKVPVGGVFEGIRGVDRVPRVRVFGDEAEVTVELVGDLAADDEQGGRIGLGDQARDGPPGGDVFGFALDAIVVKVTPALLELAVAVIGEDEPVEAAAQGPEAAIGEALAGVI